MQNNCHNEFKHFLNYLATEKKLAWDQKNRNKENMDKIDKHIMLFPYLCLQHEEKLLLKSLTMEESVPHSTEMIA